MAEADSASEIISRKAAMAIGLAHYFTGVPCKRGHRSKRTVGDCKCCACGFEHTVGYRAANREKYRQLDRRQKNKDRLKLRARDHRRYWSDVEKARKRVRIYYRKNAELVRQRAREWRRQAKIDGSPGYLKALADNRVRVLAWRKQNKDRARVNARNVKARRRKVVGTHSADDISTIKRLQHGKCAFCKTKLSGKFHVDHIKAIARGGTNFRSNLQLLCAPCNLHKGASDQIDVMRAQGNLL